MRRLVLPVVAVLLTAFYLSIGPAAHADPDPPTIAGCTYAPLQIKSESFEVIYETADEKDFFVEMFTQLADTSTPGCQDMIRTAVNWECNWHGYDYNCGAQGYTALENESYTELGSNNYNFGSTGTDGVISVYSAWTPRLSCHYYTPLIGVLQVSMGGTPYTIPIPNVFRSSDDYVYCPS